jgi:hydrogenase-4 component F
MFHHSLCKSLAFGCAGRLGQIFRSHELRRMARVTDASVVWGGGLLAALLILVGVAPFAMFLSEFIILKAAVDAGAWWAAALFLAGVGIVFVGVLRQIISLAWEPATSRVTACKPRWQEGLLVFAPPAVLLVLGIWLPPPFLHVLRQAAGILGGTP